MGSEQLAWGADPRVLRLSAAGQWVEAKEPMHADIDTTYVLRKSMKANCQYHQSVLSASELLKKLALTTVWHTARSMEWGLASYSQRSSFLWDIQVQAG